MADQVDAIDAPAEVQLSGTLTAFIDRWIYVLMAVLLITVVLVGFVPDSLIMLEAVATGRRPPLTLALHAHAVLMGSWMLLLLAQTTLMATGSRHAHVRLGIVGMILAPALVVAGLILVPTAIRSFIDFMEGAPPDVQEQFQAELRSIVDITIVQIRIGIVFPLLVFLALRARKRDSGLHKRLMILATIVPLPPALDRMTFLYHSMPESPLTIDLWPLLCVAPMFLWDLYRQDRIHRAYWIFAAIQAPAAIITNLLWGSEWWHSVAPGFLYGG